MRKKIRMGIVGAGSMGDWHASSYRKMADVDLTCCLDVVPGRAETLARKHGVGHVAANLGELLDQVDAVTVATPDREHAQTSLVVLRARKHLLCEKPLTVTLADARRVAAAAEQAGRQGVIHMVNFSYRRSAAMQRAMDMVAAGKLGPLRHVHSFYLQSWLSCNAWGNWSNEAFLWRLQTAAGSGGVLGDVGCHILDLTTAVAGDVRRIRCDLRTFPKFDAAGKTRTSWHGGKLDANDTAVIELEFSTGALGLVQATRWATGHLNHIRLEAHGAEGALRFDLQQDYHQIELCLGRAAKDTATWKTRRLAAAPAVPERFIRAIRTGRQDQPDLVRGAHVQAYLDACERSARSGKWETIRSWA